MGWDSLLIHCLLIRLTSVAATIPYHTVGVRRCYPPEVPFCAGPRAHVRIPLLGGRTAHRPIGMKVMLLANLRVNSGLERSFMRDGTRFSTLP